MAFVCRSIRIGHRICLLSIAAGNINRHIQSIRHFLLRFHKLLIHFILLIDECFLWFSAFVVEEIINKILLRGTLYDLRRHHASIRWTLDHGADDVVVINNLLLGLSSSIRFLAQILSLIHIISCFLLLHGQMVFVYEFFRGYFVVDGVGIMTHSELSSIGLIF